ncbi:hypothetical protein V0U79_06170 [Hyphobacterium sp. HN65]|uniref:Uncharacterized protein n=1 Tax=Hyphobacterium lacteum TaxID=3116575 RepID=A0ABU7LPW2_9PROT|nr:hypothetical protein [Hyphobacterium sp. HN65]MEE2525945.1 hypothetical protein [Hyphobacterium sp. HN65]
MILQRISKAVREQNWFAVLLEFVIVVAGVLVAFVVTDWSTEKADRDRETAYLQSLLVDVEQMLADEAATDSQARDEISDLLVHMQALETCSLPDAGRMAFERALVGHSVLPGISVVRSTFNEMVSAGALARMRDGRLKAAIVDAFAIADETEDYIAYFRAELGRASMLVTNRVALRTQLGDDMTVDRLLDGGVDGFVTADFDINTLCTDHLYRNGMIEVVDSRLDRVWAGQRFADEMTELHGWLERRLERDPGEEGSGS